MERDILSIWERCKSTEYDKSAKKVARDLIDSELLSHADTNMALEAVDEALGGEPLTRSSLTSAYTNFLLRSRRTVKKHGEGIIHSASKLVALKKLDSMLLPEKRLITEKEELPFYRAALISEIQFAESIGEDDLVTKPVMPDIQTRAGNEMFRKLQRVELLLTELKKQEENS